MGVGTGGAMFVSCTVDGARVACMQTFGLRKYCGRIFGYSILISNASCWRSCGLRAARAALEVLFVQRVFVVVPKTTAGAARRGAFAGRSRGGEAMADRRRAAPGRGAGPD